MQKEGGGGLLRVMSVGGVLSLGQMTVKLDTESCVYSSPGIDDYIHILYIHMFNIFVLYKYMCIYKFMYIYVYVATLYS